MKLEKYPLNTDGVLTWLSKDDYLSINLGRWNKQFGSIFTKKKLMDMLEAVEAGMQPSAQEDFSVQEVWAEMAEDVRVAQDPPCEMLDEPVIVNENSELALVQRGVQDFVIADSFSRFYSKFDLGDKMLCVTPKGDASDEELVDALVFQLLNSTASEWATGRLVNMLDDRGKNDVVVQICGQLNRSYQTISKWARTEKNIPPHLRDPRLTISHYCEIGCARFNKNPELQAAKIAELCGSALENGWNVDQTRAQVREAQGKTTTPTPRGKEAIGRYIVVYSGDACAHSYSCDQLPDVLHDGSTIIDLESASIACGCAGQFISWLPLAKGYLPPKFEEAAEELL